MTTSGSTNYSVTAGDLLLSSYTLARVVDPNETLSSWQITQGIASLNKIIKFFQKNGMPLWAIKKGIINLIKGQQSYTCGASGTGLTERPLRIVEAFYRDGASSDTPLDRVSREEYWNLGDKTIEGVPNQIYYDPQIDLGVLYVYNTADANTAGNDIHIIYQRPFEDIDNQTNTFDIPQEWYIVLEYKLAVDLAFRNGIKQTRIAQLKAEAGEYFYEVLWWDREDVPTQIVPGED